MKPPAGNRILVRGTNWLGDAVMTTPALLRLRERFPKAKISLLGPEKLEGLWQHHPAVDEFIPFGAQAGVWRTARRLRAGGFDLAVVLPNSPRSALEVFLAGIPRRVGYARVWRNFFLTEAVAPRAGAVKMRKRSAGEIQALVTGEPAGRGRDSARLAPGAQAHQIHEYLHLMAAVGASAEPQAPELRVTGEEVAAARRKFGLAGSEGLILGLNAGAEYGPAKRWPAERFQAVAKEIQRRTNCTWLLFGGRNDEKLAGEIHAALANPNSVINLAGRTTLRELMALLKLCRGLLTNDTGPMHVAAALGTSVVVPFGSTSPELTGPGLPGDARQGILKSDAVCSPCFLRECPIDFRCMKGIGVEAVIAAVLDRVKE